VHIKNSSIINNTNINKMKCGIISNYNNINFIIDNSIFKENTVRNNGGSLYV